MFQSLVVYFRDVVTKNYLGIDWSGRRLEMKRPVVAFSASWMKTLGPAKITLGPIAFR
jgi:hypothetical protein